MLDHFPYARTPVAALLLFWGDFAVCAAQEASPPSSIPPPRVPSAVAARVAQPAQALPPAIPPPVSQRLEPGPGWPGSTPPSPLATAPRLDAAPLGPDDFRFPITLATALRLSDARPLIVAAAQARAWVAEAELSRAKVLWVPDLFIGFAYLRHDGGGPDFNKGIMTAPSVNYFYGGAGLNLFLGTTDAIFEPPIARQVLNARHWDIQASKNDALMQTADAYFRVHQQRGIFAGAVYTVGRGRELVERIAALGRDLAQPYEVDRARNMVAELQQQAASARQQWRVESARLTRVLRLDPRAVVVPLEHDHAQITLIDPGRGLDDLMPVALANRPEVASRRALVEAAEVAVRREKARPFVPMVALTGFQSPFELFQAGIFGLGPNSSLNQWRGRVDVSVQPLLRFNNLLMGNLAQIKAQRGEQSLAIIDLFDAQDEVAEEVNQAHARLQAAAVRVYQAERALRTGIVAYNGSVEGLEQTTRFGDVLALVARPQEAVFALELLQRSFNEYFTTVAEYNRAQFELFHALGYPASEIALLRTPGAVIPVDTARPPFLPPVGNGPPPATR
jgi:hypothetical protein